MRFLRKVEGVTRVGNVAVTRQLNLKSTDTIGEERQFGWLRHLEKNKNNGLTKKIYEARTH